MIWGLLFCTKHNHYRGTDDGFILNGLQMVESQENTHRSKAFHRISQAIDSACTQACNLQNDA